jgi:hypothetical protein
MENAQEQPTEAKPRRRYYPAADPKVYARTRQSNGSQLLPGIDNRNLWARRCKDLILAHVNDLGGLDNISEAEKSIVRRASVLVSQLEILEAKFARANGNASNKDLDIYQRMCGALRRLYDAIGMKRRPRDLGPSLGELMKQTIIEQERT